MNTYATKSQQRITKGTGQCPDCGYHAARYKTIEGYRADGSLDTGEYHLIIDCPKCEYYQFVLEQGTV